MRSGSAIPQSGCELISQRVCGYLSNGSLALIRAPAQGVNKTVIGHHVETWAEKWGIPFKIPDRVKRNQDKAPND